MHRRCQFRLLADVAENWPTWHGVETWPRNLGLLRFPVHVDGGIERIDLQGAAIKADFARSMNSVRCHRGGMLGDPHVDGMARITPPVSKQATVIGGIVKPMTGNVQRHAPDLAEQYAEEQ